MKGQLFIVGISCISSIVLADHIPRTVEFPANATEIFGPYVQDSGTLASWMSKYPDETPLALMNIPGTHDSATWNYTEATQRDLANVTAGDGEPTYPPELFRCQSASIMSSLNAGVRFFDLRFALDPTGTKLVFWHSQALMSETATVDAIVTAFYYWLDMHPSETVILSFQYEGSTTVNATFDSTVQLMLFDILNSTTAAQYIEQTHDVLPTLGNARGKVVLFKRFDLDQLPDEYEDALPGMHLSPSLWTDDSKNITLTYNTVLNLTAYAEDYYEPDDLGHDSSAAANIAAKVNAIVAHLQMATSEYFNHADNLFITYASGEHILTWPEAVTPQIMAVGDGNSSTPLGGVNQQIHPILKGFRGKRIGIVVVDFWDQPRDLIRDIIGA
ncbi:1-phosphatidylinositol phosphodiesterase [Cytospora mali]|uniref:1-phosphatidylinositol phosphodiesterase n=1 Tax=Cytospora mali TaxID=578113 RepID=A0A194UV33_CYTMA|nr:1-phosphatidylinositol phosphodiesterase [Valsa mali var. pyri (nom. inval.)]